MNTKHLNLWTRKEFLALPVRTWNAISEYTSVILFPSRDLHDSGYRCITVIGVHQMAPVEIITQSSDDINWMVCPPTRYYSDGSFPAQLRMDSLVTSHAMHFWRADTIFRVGAALSSLDIEVTKVTSKRNEQ